MATGILTKTLLSKAYQKGFDTEQEKASIMSLIESRKVQKLKAVPLLKITQNFIKC